MPALAKLVGEVTVNFQNFAVSPCRALFYNRKFLTRTAKLRMGTDARGSKQKRCFKEKSFTKLLNSQVWILFRKFALNLKARR
ncbi:hypothetical protein FUT84_06045 [Treponema phagedenis]|nr:hypothetical protein FUT84_06045 [Treponema phagedenis]QEK05780.1 hypothetical protein FUT80_02960 [Treponema phagedenis]